MALRLVTCACGHPAMLEVGAISRAARQALPIYCTRECAGLARRLANPPTEAERKEAKRLYDARRREELSDQIKAAKREYHRRTYDPVKAAAERALKMPRHIEYCRRPEYRKWKADYDRKFRAEKQFGPFAEAFLVLQDLQTEVLARATRYEIYLASGTLNKKLQRRRTYDQTLGR